MIFSGVQRVIYLVSMWKVSKPQWIRASFQQNVNTDMPRRSLQTTTQTTRGKENSEIRSSAATTIGKKISISFCCSYMCSDWWIRCSDDVADAPVAVCATAGKQARCDPGVHAAAGDILWGGEKSSDGCVSHFVDPCLSCRGVRSVDLGEGVAPGLC